MLKTLEKLKRIKELERLIELQELENKKFELQKLEVERKRYLQMFEEKIRNFEGLTTFKEISFLREGLKKLELKREKLKEEVQSRERKIRELNLETKVISTYIDRRRETLQKEEEKREEQKLSNENLLRSSYGKFMTAILFFMILVPAFGGDNNSTLKSLPYEEKLLKPYLEYQSKYFNKLANQLLESFKALEKKEKQLEEKEKFILQKEEELKKLLQEAMNLENQQKKRLSAKVKKLLEVITKADPDSAGEILSKTPPQVAAEILINLPNVRKAGEILSSMDPDSAAKVIDTLLKKKEKLSATPVRKKIEEILKYVEQNNF